MPGLYIGVDFGTSNISAFVEGKGIVFSRPNVVATDAYTGKVLAVGDNAMAMIGRTPASVKVVRPFSDGVVSDLNTAAEILRDFVAKAGRLSVLKPNIIAGVPSKITSLERKSVLDMLDMAGASCVCIMEHPYAAALGADIAFANPKGTMIIDIGGGTVDLAVVSMGAIVTSKVISGAGEAMTHDIIRYLRRERDIEIGYLTAEHIKKTIGGAVMRNEEIALVSKGRNVISGIPLNFEITSTEIYWVLKPRVDMILDGVKEVLSGISPELSADIFENGIVLTGRGSRLYGIDSFLESRSGVPIRIAKDPGLCVAKGLGKAVHRISKLRKNGYEFRFREEL